jgi:hypothetical protein
MVSDDADAVIVFVNCCVGSRQSISEVRRQQAGAGSAAGGADADDVSVLCRSPADVFCVFVSRVLSFGSKRFSCL